MLVPRFTLGDLDLTEYPFAVEFGTDLGDPDNVVEIINSLLADGEIELSSRRGNRTMTVPVLIDESDLLAVAQAEALLTAECDKPQNTFAIDPGDGIAPVTVFDTFRAQARFKRSDDEERAGVRRYELSFRALPFGRSVDKIVDTAGTPPSSGGTLLYNCESTTGWSSYAAGTYSPVFAVDSTIFIEGAGSVRSRAQSYDGYYFSNTLSVNHDQLTGLSISTGTGGYLTISIRLSYESTVGGAVGGLKKLWMTTAAGETQVTSFATIDRSANGFVRYAWAVGSGLTVTALRFEIEQYGSDVTDTGIPNVWYDDIELLPSATTDHQIVKTLNVEGSARTTGSLHIAAPSDVIALGQVLAITAPTSELPAGFQPDGRRWVTQGGTTTDSTALHGGYYTPDATTYSTAAGKPIFDVPVGMLTPGPYTIVALVNSTTSTLNFGVQARLRYGMTDTGPLSAAEVTQPTTAGVWRFVTVGTVYLPPLPMQSADTTAKVRLLFKGANLADIYMIPAWQVGGRPVADFSIVDCGSGTVAAGGPSSNLWIDSPDAGQPQGGWWRGPTSDRLNAQSAWPDAKKPGIHTFNPGSLTAFLVSTGAQGPTLALEYFPRWPNAAAL